MTRGMFLRVLREEVGLSIRQVAIKVGTSRQHLQQLENDKVAQPGFDVIARLMAFYGERLDDFAAMEKPGQLAPRDPGTN